MTTPPNKSGRSVLQAPIAPDQLRNHATSQRVESVWQRLQASLPSGVAPRATGAVVGLRAWTTGIAVSTALAFGVGVIVGANFSSTDDQDAVSLRADRLAPARPSTVVAGSPRLVHESESNRVAGLPRNVTRQRGAVALDPVLPTGDPSTALVESVPSELPAVEPIPGWQLLAQQGEYQQALAAIEASGGFETAVSQATADQLMLLVDVARDTGFRQRAVQALRRIVNQHATDPLAPLAAWSLGNMLQNSGDREGAAQAFAAYRTLSPQGDFAEDALAREIRMAVERGDAQLVKRLLAQYDQAFPNGRRGAEIEQLAGRQGEGATAPDAGTESSE